MQEFTLVNKYRFVFSDFENEEIPLKHAKIKFDLTVHAVDTPKN